VGWRTGNSGCAVRTAAMGHTCRSLLTGIAVARSTDRWPNLRDAENTRAVIALFHQRYARLWQKGGFPRSLRPRSRVGAVPESSLR